MNQFILREKFSEHFFEEFQYDAEFRNLFESMVNGTTPFQVIEHLCKSKKTLLKILEEAIKNVPKRLILTTEQFKQVIQK